MQPLFPSCHPRKHLNGFRHQLCSPISFNSSMGRDPCFYQQPIFFIVQVSRGCTNFHLCISVPTNTSSCNVGLKVKLQSEKSNFPSFTCGLTSHFSSLPKPNLCYSFLSLLHVFFCQFHGAVLAATFSSP